MKITILDSFTENPGDLSWEPVTSLGETTIYPRTSKTDTDEIIARVSDADTVVTNKTPITRRVLDACPNVKLVALLSTGTDICDGAYARERGVTVCNVPAYSTMAVAQHAMALLLEICSSVGLMSQSVHDGEWDSCLDFCYWKRPLIELDGLTVGVIGFGKIGRAFGRAAKAFGMNVIAAGSRPTPEGQAIAEYVSLDELLRRADVISLHCPLTPDTREIINRSTISRMRDGVIILNTGRGGLVNEQALADGLNTGKVYAAGVDVVSVEPIERSNPLLTAKNCFITPHIAWAPRSCRQRVMDITAENIRLFYNGTPQNVVN